MYSFIQSWIVLQHLLGPGLFFSFVIFFFYTNGRTPWTRDQPVARPLLTDRATQTEETHTQTSMPWVEFEPTIAKTVHALRCPYTYLSGSARVPMNQTRLCVGRHEPGSAESGWARQGLRWGSAPYWLVRVWVVTSQARNHVGSHV
jgi:hypothetical protein